MAIKAAVMGRLAPELTGEMVEIAELPTPEPVGPHDVVVSAPWPMPTPMWG